MTLKEIKIRALEKNISMTELSIKIGIKREIMYYRISIQEKGTIMKIKELLF